MQTKTLKKAQTITHRAKATSAEHFVVAVVVVTKFRAPVTAWHQIWLRVCGAGHGGGIAGCTRAFWLRGLT